jgi:hypothetical protein
MSKLVFVEMILLSKTEKRARRIKFSQKNVIQGKNDVGKSTLIKSLYHALGADTPKINNSRWKKANPIYALKFAYDQKKFTIIRDQKYFGLFLNEKLVGKYSGIAREGGVADAINPLLNFDLELENKDDKLVRLGPSYYFLPFYIDQDLGWNQSWDSFDALSSVKTYRQKMLDYHLGIRPQAYYDAQKNAFRYKAEQAEIVGKKSDLITVRDNYKTRKNKQRVDIDPIAFKAEIEALVDEYNKVSEYQQEQLKEIQKARNQKVGLENDIELLAKVIKELEKDYLFCESPATPNEVSCPNCGTIFSNSIKERFGILDDADYCLSLMDQRKRELIIVNEELKELDAKYDELFKKMNSIDDIMQVKRESITFAEVVAAEGYKDVLRSIGSDLSALDEQHGALETAILGLKADTKLDTKMKEQIVDFYQQSMKSSLNSLNVHVLEPENYETPYKVIDANALGSDLPRSLLAQYFSFLKTIEKFNKFVLCPLVIDSPLQQDQDKANAGTIFDFIFANTLKDQQLILGTVQLEGLKSSRLPSDLNVISLEKEFSLLSPDEYHSVLEEVHPLHSLTLEVESE